MSQPTDTDVRRLLRDRGLNPDEWEVREVKLYTTPMKVGDEAHVEEGISLHARPISEEIISRKYREELLAEIREQARPPEVRHYHEGDYLVEYDLFDAHFQMLAWGVETGSDYDLLIAEKDFKAALDDLAARARELPVGRALLPVGNDLFHTDAMVKGSGGATAYGNVMDVDTRKPKAIRVVRDVLTYAIERLLEQSPVDVVTVPGNHDPESTWWMGEILDAQYSQHPHVRVDNRPMPRKFYRYGNSQIGFAHGQKEKPKRLATIMAQQDKQNWAECDFHEWHLGHFHREKVVESDIGVPIRYMPSLAGTDAWHSEKTYVGEIRAARAFVWSQTQGIDRVLHHNIVPTQTERMRTAAALRGDR